MQKSKTQPQLEWPETFLQIWWKTTGSNCCGLTLKSGQKCVVRFRLPDCATQGIPANEKKTFTQSNPDSWNDEIKSMW